MTPTMQLKWLALGSLAAAWLVIAAFFASTGAFLIDELVYSAMIERFATAGALTIPNGYAAHPSESLLVKFLVAGPNGLVPQYPAGYAVLAAPFFLIGGLQGVIFLNALASVLTLVVLYGLAKTLFDDRDLALNAALIYGLATFASEYAFGIWPHAVSVLFVALAAYCAARSFDAPDRSGWALAILAGLATSVGATMRVDVIIAAPVLGAWLLGGARKPIARTAGLALGVGAGLLLSAWLNYLKFGDWMPISYGRGLGATTFSAYLPLLPLGIAVSALAIALALPRVQRVLMGARGAILAAGAIVALLALPWTRDVFLRLLDGLNVLLVDLQSYPHIDERLGAQRLEGGPVLFFGLLKKALFQSLPYLGFALLPIAGLFRPERRAAFALCCLMPAVWFVPFAYYYWYGGMASNMRYFTPVLPFLAILAAAAWREVRAHAPGARSWAVLGGAAGLLAAPIAFGLWRADAGTVLFSAHLLFPNVLFFAAVAMALLWVAVPALQARMRRAATLVFAIGLTWAFYSSVVFDSLIAQKRRNLVLAAHQSFSRIEKNAHVVALQPEMFLFQLQREGATLAVYDSRDVPIDFALIDDALRQGRPVYLHTYVVADALRSDAAASRYEVVPLSEDTHGLYAVKHAGQKSD